MVSAISSALSGLKAASKRIEVSSTNLANQHSTKSKVDGQITNEPYRAQRVDQVTLTGGGVQTIVHDDVPATVPVFDPDNPDADANGVLQVPNVDTANELVNIKIASASYRTNLGVIRTQDKLDQSLLDILS